MEENFSMEWNMEEKFLYGMEDFWYGMEENCQYGIWKNHLPYHALSISVKWIECLLLKR